ncbi:MAG: outer membrane protein assembly factor BamD [Hydrogenophilus thermoluteolus]
MKRWFLVTMAAATLAGCGLLPEKIDETRSWNAQKLYSEARAAMDDGDYQRAAELLEKLESRYPFGRYAQQAQIETAYAYYKQGEPELALAAIERFLRLHPDHPNLDYMLYLKGLILFNEDRSLFAALGNQDMSERDPKAAKESLEVFLELLRRFPESKYAEDAEARVIYLRNSLARHELHVARYYLKRGAYLAAANRAKVVVTDYSDTPLVEDALWLMREAYDRLGLTDLKTDAERVLQLNFPDSDYLKYGERRSKDKKPWWQFW